MEHEIFQPWTFNFELWTAVAAQITPQDFDVEIYVDLADRVAGPQGPANKRFSLNA